MIYLEYIKNEEDKLELENKKRNFRNSLNNYDLDENYNLCFKHIKKDKIEDLHTRRNSNRPIK